MNDDASLYNSVKCTRRITLSFAHLMKYGNTPEKLKSALETHISNEVEGKCGVEGYVEPNSVKLLSHSCGQLNGPNIVYDIEFECNICNPGEGEVIKCRALTTTLAGIRAVASKEYVPSPIEVYLARDLHRGCKIFNDVKEGNHIYVKIIGSRFVLNDSHVSIIGNLISISQQEPEVQAQTPVQVQQQPQVQCQPQVQGQQKSTHQIIVKKPRARKIKV